MTQQSILHFVVNWEVFTINIWYVRRTASQQEAAVWCQQIWLPIVNGTVIEQTDLFIFILLLFHFAHLACMTTVITN